MINSKSVNLKDSRPLYELSEDSVAMTVYPRVHMFSLDLSLRDNGIPCGSFGASVTDQPIRVSAKSVEGTDNIKSSFEGDKSIRHLLQTVRNYTNQHSYWEVEVDYPKSLRPHTGLGTSTQILGGVALCAAKSAGVELNHIDLFNMGMGHASALGLSLLFEPGLIIEHGYRLAPGNGGAILHPTLGTSPELPSGSILKVENLPWYMILGTPVAEASLSGAVEQTFWNNLLPDDVTSAESTLRAVNADIIPAMLKNDFAQFTRGIDVATKQPVKLAEEAIQSLQTAAALHRLRESFGFSAVSSLGPTMYSFSEVNPATVLADLTVPGYEFRAMTIRGLGKEL